MIRHRVFRRGKVGPAGLSAALDELGIQHDEEFVVMRWGVAVTRVLATVPEPNTERPLTDDELEGRLIAEFDGTFMQVGRPS